MAHPSRSGKRRKAQWSPSAKLAVFIIAIAVLVVLVILYGSITKIFVTGVDKEACKQSIRLNSHAKLKTRTGTDLSKYIVDPYGNAIELQCATEYLEVKGKEPEVLKKKIADSMVDCWQMYGEGELEVFDTEDNNYCAICSRLEFKEATQLPGFTNYLMTNMAPMQETTYLEYFQGSGRRCGADSLSEEEVAALVEGSGISQLDTLDTSSPLAVMFVMNKDAYPNNVFETGKLELAAIVGGPASYIGLGVGLVAGIALCVSGIGCAAGGPLIITVLTAVPLVAGTTAAGGILFGSAGAATGYALGSACTADYDAYVMLWNYSDLKSLDCTYLESEATPLKTKEI